jgi:hypothetical protein
MIFDLHLVLEEKMLFKLKEISCAFKIKSVSATIVYLFDKFIPYLEKMQIEFQNRKSGYKLIADPKEKRRHFHVYTPEKMYRKLKELHQYLNFYSMAQILREVVEIYLKDCKNISLEKAMKNILTIKKNWEKKKILWKGKLFIRQLYIKNSTLPSISIIYDQNHHPFSIGFLR